ncbi:MAG: hypothetical protein LUG18_14440 [Candidatus Azobacteroides sp.]|nr:hypothetical protein [Candidatus Azobacteroides sp.]
MKKRLLIIVSTVFFMVNGYTQSPDAFHYQAIVADQGEIISEQEVQVIFNIRINTPDGDMVYSETHATRTNSAGMIFLKVGQGDVVSGDFSLINWAKGPYFIETLMNKGNGMVFTGTQQLLSVPYAKYADEAGQIRMVSSGGKIWTLTIDESGNTSATEITE